MSTWNQESMAWNPESQDCLEFPYMGKTSDKPIICHVYALLTSSFQTIKIYRLFPGLDCKVITTFGKIWRQVVITSIGAGKASTQALREAKTSLWDMYFPVSVENNEIVLFHRSRHIKFIKWVQQFRNALYTEFKNITDYGCDGLKPGSHFISRLRTIVRVNVVVNRTVVDSDWRFNNLWRR